MRLSASCCCLNPENGLRDFHQQMWSEPFLDQPHISQVDLAAVSVTRATYDSDINALVVTLVPGPVPTATTHFTVVGLDRAKPVMVHVNGVRKEADVDDTSFSWNTQGELLIRRSLEKGGESSYVVQQ